jgi:hypothetical protein
MTSIRKASLLATASVLAIGLSAMTPAHAFDTVDWRWNATVTENINKNVNVNIDISPTGMVMVESLQGHIGDINATSTVTGITNNQPSPGGVTEDVVIPFQFHYGLNSVLGVVVIDDDFKSPDLLTATVDEGDQAPNINGTVVGTIGVGGFVIPATATLAAATELASITSAATAVTNNLAIDSDTAVQLHIGQFAVGGLSGEGGVPAISTGNSNLTVAAVLATLAANGGATKADVRATSTVSDIINASVNSSATAVANNLTVTMAPNGLLIGDVTQFSLANVTATSNVTNVGLSNYSGLGSLTRPVVGSVATAVGNNASISVKAPVVAAP